MVDLRREVPPTLYKFYSLTDSAKDGIQDIDNKKLQTLKNEQIWLSSVCTLNDPFEVSLAYINKDIEYNTEIPKSYSVINRFFE